jgi:ABC-type tungstate transport system substrate-binding protein
MIKDKILLYTITSFVIGSFLFFLLYSLYICFNICNNNNIDKKNNNNINTKNINTKNINTKNIKENQNNYNIFK